VSEVPFPGEIKLSDETITKHKDHQDRIPKSGSASCTTKCVTGEHEVNLFLNVQVQ